MILLKLPWGLTTTSPIFFERPLRILILQGKKNCRIKKYTPSPWSPATELWRIDGHFYTKVIGMNPQHQVNGEEHLVAVRFTLVLK